jgi:hypothetical protein
MDVPHLADYAPPLDSFQAIADGIPGISADRKLDGLVFSASGELCLGSV